MKITDNQLNSLVKEFRDKVKEDGTLYCPLDSAFLAKFIRARKYSVESAFQTLKKYYEMRLCYKQDFEKFHPSALKSTLASGIFMVLKQRDEFGRKIMILRTELWDLSRFSAESVFSTALLLGEEMILCPETQENGTVMIHDLSHLGLSHARQYNLGLIKKHVAVLQGSFPAKFKTIHVLNQPYIYNVLLAITQPFLSKKFMSRISFVGNNYAKLHKAIAPEILPTCYGGLLSLEEAEDKEFMKRLMEKDEYYRGMLEFGIRMDSVKL